MQRFSCFWALKEVQFCHHKILGLNKKFLIKHEIDLFFNVNSSVYLPNFTQNEGIYNLFRWTFDPYVQMFLIFFPWPYHHFAWKQRWKLITMTLKMKNREMSIKKSSQILRKKNFSLWTHRGYYSDSKAKHLIGCSFFNHFLQQAAVSNFKKLKELKVIFSYSIIV